MICDYNVTHYLLATCRRTITTHFVEERSMHSDYSTKKNGAPHFKECITIVPVRYSALLSSHLKSETTACGASQRSNNKIERKPNLHLRRCIFRRFSRKAMSSSVTPTLEPSQRRFPHCTGRSLHFSVWNGFPQVHLYASFLSRSCLMLRSRAASAFSCSSQRMRQLLQCRR